MRSLVDQLRIVNTVGVTFVHYQMVVLRALAWYLKRHYQAYPRAEKKLESFIFRARQKGQRSDIKINAMFLASPRILPENLIFAKGKGNQIIAFPQVE